MKNVIIILRLLAIICACLLLEGCIVAAVGAGIGAVKYANSKKTEAEAKDKEANAKNMDSYNQYELGMQKVNIERAEKNLPPVKIMTYKEYLNADN